MNTLQDRIRGSVRVYVHERLKKSGLIPLRVSIRLSTGSNTSIL